MLLDRGIASESELFQSLFIGVDLEDTNMGLMIVFCRAISGFLFFSMSLSKIVANIQKT